MVRIHDMFLDQNIAHRYTPKNRIDRVALNLNAVHPECIIFFHDGERVLWESNPATLAPKLRELIDAAGSFLPAKDLVLVGLEKVWICMRCGCEYTPKEAKRENYICYMADCRNHRLREAIREAEKIIKPSKSRATVFSVLRATAQDMLDMVVDGTELTMGPLAIEEIANSESRDGGELSYEEVSDWINCICPHGALEIDGLLRKFYTEEN